MLNYPDAARKMAHPFHVWRQSTHDNIVARDLSVVDECQDAESLGILDNDWVEVFNDNGVVVTRAVVSSRIPPGICMQYHAPERTHGIPLSPLRKNRRAGGHNSLTRTRLKPNFMIGGYGQFTLSLQLLGAGWLQSGYAFAGSQTSG
jgi:nitrate reductase alpha subunit